MSSTEFTIGMSSTRNSSKVLKPPGGGSSDIFGNQPIAPNVAVPQKTETKDRLFGDSETVQSHQKGPNRMQSDIFNNANNQQFSKPSQKKYLQRNPITGEGCEIDSEKNGEEDDETKENIDYVPVEAVVEEKKEFVVPPVPEVKTKASCIRVRQPPGGKSSGIF